MQASGAKLSFAKIAEKMPGRTPKALTHLWEKFSKDYADGGNAAASTSSAAAATGTAGDGDPATPVNKRGKAGKFHVWRFICYACSGVFFLCISPRELFISDPLSHP